MSKLAASSIARVLFVVSVLSAGLMPNAALAYSTCDAPQLKSGSDWLVPLFDGDCAVFHGRLTQRSELLSDGSRGDRFEVPLVDAACVQVTIQSADFTPDVFIYDDDTYSHEVGVWQRSGRQATSTLRLSGVDDSVPVYYVLATSYGPGAQFGSYTLDLETC
jgi:hypothetical protein